METLGGVYTNNHQKKWLSGTSTCLVCVYTVFHRMAFKKKKIYLIVNV